MQKQQKSFSEKYYFIQFLFKLNFLKTIFILIYKLWSML